MPAKHSKRAGVHRQHRRRATSLPVRQWLVAGAASAGMTATLYGLTVLSPEVSLASADDGTTSSSTEAGRDDSAGKGPATRTPSTGSDQPERDRASRTADASSAAQATSLKSGRDSSGARREHADEDGGESDLRTRRTGTTPRSAVAGVSGSEARTVSSAPDEIPEKTTVPDPQAAALPVVSTSASEEPAAVAVTTETVTPRQSVVVSANGPDGHRQWVADQIAAWVGANRALISMLPVPEPVKAWFTDSLAGTRRTLLNQAPWLSPVQVSGEGNVPIVGHLGAVDLEGDEIRYVIVTQPTSGVVSIDEYGTFTYTPNVGFTGVDNFVVSATDLGTHFNLLDPFRTASTVSSLLVNQSAVSFVFNYTTGSQYWTPEARAALQRAASNLLGQFIVKTPVIVTYDIAGHSSSSSTTLAWVDSPLISSGAGFFPTVVQHKLLTGIDANGVAADGHIDWNFSYPWAFGDYVPGLQYDFTTVAMHELLHSFGFMSYVETTTTETRRNWTLYDKFLQSNGGSRLIGSDFRFNSALVANLRGGNGGIFLGGAGAVAAYGTPVPVYTPTTWTQGSSVSHVDSKVFSGSNRVLMNPQVPTGLGPRTLSAAERGIMQDLGYTLAPIHATSALAFVGFIFIRRKRAAAAPEMAESR